MNISSIVVRTHPERQAQVAADLVASGLCEIHFQDDQGRIIVTIEGADVQEEAGKLKAIQALPHVLTADLAYAFSDRDFADESAPSPNDPPPGASDG